MAISRSLLAATVFAFIAASAHAEILKVPGGVATVVTNADTPTRGMSKSQVQRRYGAPVNKQGAVGRPPISRWDYSDYSVYFEHHLVLHSVVRTN